MTHLSYVSSYASKQKCISVFSFVTVESNFSRVSEFSQSVTKLASKLAPRTQLMLNNIKLNNSKQQPLSYSEPNDDSNNRSHTPTLNYPQP